VLESHLDMQLWPVSSVLINTWKLNKWDCIVCKWSYGKVKILKDYHAKNIQWAWPSTPVLVVWLDSVCDGWDIIQVVSDIEKARIKALEYKELMVSKKSWMTSSIDLIMSKIKSWNLKQLKIVVKSDTNGSLEALKWALLKLSTNETKVNIIHCWVWNITEGDVLMCQWSSALLIWFNVSLLWNTKNIIEDTRIEYISSQIIYHITERVEKIITGMLDPKEVEIQLWNAIVWGIFYADKWFMILGLKLKSGWLIQRWAQVRIIRKDKFLWNGKIESLKSWVIDVHELEWPIECWVKLKSEILIEMWDIFEVYKIEIHK
jgi:translation initiation factor IF-2